MYKEFRYFINVHKYQLIPNFRSSDFTLILKLGYINIEPIREWRLLSCNIIQLFNIDWNICPEVLGMTKGSIARGHRPSANRTFGHPMTKGQMFQSIAPETIK